MNNSANDHAPVTDPEMIQDIQKKKTLIFIPTYNERDNIESIAAQLLALEIGADILFVDDNSPDGTGQALDQLALKYPNIFVKQRERKLGIGTAHVYGLNWAFENKYDYLITMDCDFTHSPDYIKSFLANANDADIVVGSRYMQEGSLNTWNKWRKSLTHLGHWATGIFLNMPYDATGSYRLYHLDRLPKELTKVIYSTGYSFFFESLFILNQNGYRIKEIPTHLPARTYGHSKMKLSDVFHSIKRLVTVFFAKSFNPQQFQIPADPYKNKIVLDAAINDPQDWNQYWARKDAKQVHATYDTIASFYRNFIILPSLNKCVRENFDVDSVLLHAGCGGGQVDRDICNQQKVIALDISGTALELYGRLNGRVTRLVHGSIFAIPLENESVDGIYNLGVMEHFSEAEIQKILLEFYRVLKPGGKIMLFWPPRLGLSVLVLKFAHFVFNDVLKKKIKLHPDEITHIKSKAHAQHILQKAQFKLLKYDFNIKDVFTHAIVVGVK